VLAVVQLDAMATEVVDRMLATGDLPALAALRARGTQTTLTSPARALEGGTSHTLYSGRGIPDHGLYFPLQWSAPQQRIRPVEAFEPPEFVWERLSRAGRRCLVLDPYQAPPPGRHRGLFLSGWQYRNRVTNRASAVPVEAARTFARDFGRAPVIDETFGRLDPKRLIAFGERLAASPARAADVVTRVLGESQYDLVWVNLPGVHLGGHHFWDKPELLGGIYSAADAALGRIVAALPEDADMIVVSPLGMGPETSRADLLPGMLSAVLDGEGRRLAPEDRISRVRARIPTGLRAAIARPLPARITAALTARLSLSNVDWSRTRAFALPSNHEGCIRFNVRGRERDGIVEPTETGELTERIAAGLTTFDDADGGPAVAEVYAPQERLGDGPRSHLLPDLVVEWSERRASGLDGVRSPRFGEVRRTAGSGRTGGHTAEAWALLVPERSRVQTPSRAADVVDVAATAWALVTSDADGPGGEPLLAK
jgi:predicted AlkP superfamily phosphohydrolase/phosphomutase